jgi:O-antigen ligase
MRFKNFNLSLIILLTIISIAFLSTQIKSINVITLILFIIVLLYLLIIKDKRFIFFMLMFTLIFTNKFTLFELNTGNLITTIDPGIKIGFIDIFLLVLFLSLFSKDNKSRSMYTNTYFSFKKFIILFGIYLTIMVLNTITSINIDLSIFSLLFNIKLLIFSILIYKYYKPNEHFVLIFYALIYSSIILFILAIGFSVLKINALATFFMGNNFESFSTRDDTYRAVGTFHHPGELGVYLGIIFPFFFSCFLLKYKKNISLILTIILVIILALSGSRGALISTFCSSIVVYVLYKKLKLNTILKLLGVFFLIVILLGTMANNLFFGTNSQNMVQDRLNFLKLSSQVIEKRTLFWGVGPNAYTSSSITINDTEGIPKWAILDYLTTPVHNIYVLQLAELGLFGLLFWLLIFIYTLIKTLKNIQYEKKDDIKIINLTAIGSIVHYLIYGLTGWTPLQEYFQWLIFLLISLNYKSINNKYIGVLNQK